MFHGTLTLVTPIRPEAVGELRAALKRLDHAIQTRRENPLRGIRELYFAHWGISADERLLLFGADLRLPESLTARGQLRACVTLLVDRLAAQAPDVAGVFETLYAACEGYPPRGLRAPEQVERYLLAHAVPYNTRHVDFVYRVASVQDVRQLVTVRSQVDAYLNEPRRVRALEGQSASAVREALRERLETHLSHVSGPAWRRSLNDSLRTAALMTLLYLPLDPLLHWVLQLKQRLLRPPRTVERVRVADSVREQIERRQGPVQNSMILVSDVPDRWLGRLRQRFFMALVDWRLLRNVVGLNDVRTLHCARWAVFKRGPRRQLLFMVTYDESWESYIDTFVDHEDVSTFLKLIWSGSPGFPSGLPFVEPFKQWIRSVQCPSQVHYSAFIHGAKRPQPFALTDLHERAELGRVLTARPPRAPREDLASRALGVFLEQGRFPYQDKLLSPGRSVTLLWRQLCSALRHAFTPSRSASHATLAQMGVLAARAGLRSLRPQAHPGPFAGATGRRPGTRRVWLQVHGGRRLPVPEDRGRRPGPGVAAGGPEGGAHDGGTDSSRGA